MLGRECSAGVVRVGVGVPRFPRALRLLRAVTVGGGGLSGGGQSGQAGGDQMRPGRGSVQVNHGFSSVMCGLGGESEQAKSQPFRFPPRGGSASQGCEL